MSNIQLLIGLPGSGKSTHAKKMSDKGYIVASVDPLVYMCHADRYDFKEELRPLYGDMLLAVVSRAVRRGYDVVVDSTNLTKNNRRYWIKTYGDEHNISAICWEPNPPLNIINRLKEDRGYPTERWVEVINKMAKEFQMPTVDEGFESLIFYEVLTKGTPGHS